MWESQWVNCPLCLPGRFLCHKEFRVFFADILWKFDIRYVWWMSCKNQTMLEGQHRVLSNQIRHFPKQCSDYCIERPLKGMSVYILRRAFRLTHFLEILWNRVNELRKSDLYEESLQLMNTFVSSDGSIKDHC